MRAELLLTPDPAPVSRYRRRIVGLGIFVALLFVGIGAPMYLQGIERDLERRVPEELAEVGFPGLTASFSGQAGVLRCPAPLPDPEGTLHLAHEIVGVAVVTLDRSCRVSSAPTVTAATTPSPPPAGDVGSGTDELSVGPEETPTTLAAFDTVGELLRSGSRFSVLASLAGEADLVDLVDGAGPITVFAPDNDAFDALTADVLAELRNEPELLAEVLRHHMVPAVRSLADLRDDRDDPIETLDGSILAVTRDGSLLRVDDATVGDGDLNAGNGVVHAIDRVLMPEGVELRSLAGLPEFVVVLRPGSLELSGPVASGLERLRLVTAASIALDPGNVIDDIEVDPDGALGGDPLETLLELLPVLPTALTTGSAGFDGTNVFVRGTVLDDDSRAALDDIAARRDVTLELEARPVATSDDAQELQAELSEFVDEFPFEFEPDSADLAEGTEARLDVLAALVKRFDGLLVTVEGHTDTAGNPRTNLDLSEFRAAVVYLGLIQRGVPPEQLDFVGRGGEAPVLVGGVEDPAASRRVELVVERVE